MWLEALMTGAKALLKGGATVVGQFVREVVKEIDDTRIGRVIGRVAEAALDRLDAKASTIAQEEGELYERAKRDGRFDMYANERLAEIHKERDALRAELNKARQEKAATDITENADDLKTVDLTDDEVSGNTDLVTSRSCTQCGGTMTLRQGNFSVNLNRRRFYWQCENVFRYNCPSVTYNPQADKSSILRRANADFDLSKEQRDEIWNREDVSAETHARLRSHLGDDDKDVICPVHLLRMKMLPKRLAGGRMLDSYEYVCLGVSSDGTACQHTVPVMSKPQVASILHRTDGQGIIK